MQVDGHTKASTNTLVPAGNLDLGFHTGRVSSISANRGEAFWKNGLWYSYNDYLTARFGERVYKTTVSGGFTCPTRDGRKGTKGCAFCDEQGSASYYSGQQASLAIQQQLKRSMPYVRRRFKVAKFIAYFQSFTNTYAPVQYLQQVYDAAFSEPDIVGLAIGTRPDCVPNDVLRLLNRYGVSSFVNLEIGLQSFRNDSLEFYERGHTAEEGIDAVKRALQFPNLHIGVHMMFGAPDETVEDAVWAAKKLNELGVHGVKVHNLMILKNTILAERYAIQPWPLLELETYNEMLIAFLENLNPAIHVERTHGLASIPSDLVGPSWSADRFLPINLLMHTMKARGSLHGKNF